MNEVKIRLNDTHVYDLWIYVNTNGFVYTYIFRNRNIYIYLELYIDLQYIYIQHSKSGSGELYFDLFVTISAKIFAKQVQKVGGVKY